MKSVILFVIILHATVEATEVIGISYRLVYNKLENKAWDLKDREFTINEMATMSNPGGDIHAIAEKTFLKKTITDVVHLLDTEFPSTMHTSDFSFQNIVGKVDGVDVGNLTVQRNTWRFKKEGQGVLDCRLKKCGDAVENGQQFSMYQPKPEYDKPDFCVNTRPDYERYFFFTRTIFI